MRKLVNGQHFDDPRYSAPEGNERWEQLLVARVVSFFGRLWYGQHFVSSLFPLPYTPDL